MNGKLNVGSTSVDLYITHLDHVGPYLKIIGQVNRETLSLMSKRIEQLVPTCIAIEPSYSLARQQALVSPGKLCIHKRTFGAAPGDYEYIRVRVLNTSIDDKMLSDQAKMRAEIEYYDYGFKNTVNCTDLLFPKEPLILHNTPNLSTHYIMLGICAGWEKAELDEVSALVLNQTVQISLEKEICGQKFVTVQWKDFSLADFLVQQKKIGAPITNDLMLDHCLKMWKDAPQLAFNNNNIYQNNNNLEKSPMDVARAQLAATRSLSARLAMQRSAPTSIQSEKPFNPSVPEPLSTRPQSVLTESLPQQVVMANVTNIIPPIASNAVYAGTAPYSRSFYQQPSHAAEMTARPVGNPYTPKEVPRALNTYYNVRLGKPVTKSPYHSTTAGTMAPPPRYIPPMMKADTIRPPSTLVQQRVKPAFLIKALTVGLTYDVGVSFVENGPHLFWVQLKNEMSELQKLMGEIEHTPLLNLVQLPEVGTACVARFIEDGHCYRALVSTIFPNKVRVVYVDYGNSAVVEMRDLYDIPHELLNIKPFAFRFSLAGVKELAPIDSSLRSIFKGRVEYNDFQLTVQPAESVASVQSCELKDRDGQVIIDWLKKTKNSRQAYASAEHLKNDDVVEIRFIESPSNFYVQKVENINKFEQLMDQMFSYYNANQVVPTEFVLGSPCIVKCDREWYRAEILRVEPSSIVVRHVDFGYEQKVKRHLIGVIAEKHLDMQRQAIKCCLKGFENSELGQDKITDQFEMLAEESNIRRRTFTVRVFRIEPDGLNVVNLLAKSLNVMKKLYKLSMPFDQYLSLEKGQFNVSKAPSNAMSIVSTGDPLPLAEKPNILNSTTVESEDRMKLQKQPRNKNSDWDKHSSSSSRDNRESQASGNTVRQIEGVKRPQPQQQQQRAERNRRTNSDSNFESQSTSSYNSSMSSPRKGNRRGAAAHNGKDENKNGRLNNNQSPRKEQPQRQDQRSKNAPQGFAQKPQRQKSTLDGMEISRKSTTAESDSNSVDSKSSPTKPEKYVPLDKAFAVEDIKTPIKESAVLGWWVSPFQFYIVPKHLADKYDNLLREMKQFYRQKPHQPLQIKVGSSVVVRRRKDGAVMRGTVVACNHMLRKYRVFCVDDGNSLSATSEDLWQVEERFAEAPCLAYRCSLDSVVSNYEHLYIVDRNEKFVPPTAKVECEFLKRQPDNNNTFIVNLFVNKVSLKDTLVKANILTEVAPEVRVGLLSGQQIRGKFTTVRDMTNFQIQFECCKSVNFLCSYDDTKFVKANLDLAKPFKDFYEGKSIIFNVKDVCENNIIYIRPVMPLFKEDRSNFICSYPIILSTFQGTVVYTAKPYRVYVQPSDVEPIIKDLLDDMFEFYENNGQLLSKFEKDQFCAAHCPDGNWYRARIIGKDAKNSQIEVFYIDYGNTEKLSRNDLKFLEEKFHVDKSSYGIEINLPMSRFNNDEKLKAQLDKLLQEKIVTIKPIEVRRNHLIADVILENNQNVLDILKADKFIGGRDIDYMRKQLEKEKPHTFEYIETVDLTVDDDEERKKIKTAPVNAAPKEPKMEKQQPITNKQAEKAETSVEERKLKPEVQFNEATILKKSDAIVVTSDTQNAVKETSATADALPLNENSAVVAAPLADPYEHLPAVVLSHCDNPAQFYVHHIHNLRALGKLQENLQIVSSSLPHLMSVVDGAICISYYSVAKQWYRAKIIDAELMVLQFIDYGNTDCVSDPTDVKECMWPHMLPFCEPFALPIRPNGTADWVDAANSVFNDSYHKPLRYEYLTHGDYTKRSYVNIYIDGVDVAKKLIADGYAKPLEYVTSGTSCFISHANSICDFYLQLERDCKVLDLIERYLKDADKKLEHIEHFEKSMIVAALFEDDGLWYRAELLRKLPENRYEVVFIDYGNTSTTSKCLFLSKEIANMPKLSKKCSLQLPSEYKCWSNEAEQKFAEITGDGELVFTTELLQPGTDCVVLNLFVDENNIIDQLLPLCERVKQQKKNTTSVNADIHEQQGTQIKAVVTHVDSPNCFYLQFYENVDMVESISGKLNNSKLDLLEGNCKEGDLCVAQFQEDKEFYRACVLEVLNTTQNKYRVVFIDFGNQALADSLYAMPSEFKDVKPLAEKHALQNWEKFMKHPNLGSGALDALVDSCNGEVFVEHIDKSAVPPLVKLTSADKHAFDISEHLQKVLDSEMKPLLDCSTSTKCIISYGNSPKSFYIQLERNSTQLDLVINTLKLMNKEKLVKLENAAVKQNCVCYSIEDKCYYRACITSILPDNKSYELFLLDYGNTLSVQDVYQMPEEISKISPMAVHCQLNQIPADIEDAKLEMAFAALLENHFGELFEFVNEVNNEDNKQHTVQLLINYKDFAQELAETVAGRQESIVAELKNCIVVQYDAPTSFYVQMEQDVPALEQLTDQLLDAEQTLAIFNDFKVGALCVALFPEDGVFYRAEIVKVLENSACEVHFIDFGNNAVTAEFRQLPEELAKLPRYSKHCELESASIVKCDLAELQAFINTHFSETFQLEILATKGDTQVVRLFYQNTNIVEKLRLQDN